MHLKFVILQPSEEARWSLLLTSLMVSRIFFSIKWFTVSVNALQAEVLTAAFVERGVDARMLVGTTAPRHRIHLLEDFRNGVFPVLVNCAILTEGADVPAIDCVRSPFHPPRRRQIDHPESD